MQLELQWSYEVPHVNSSHVFKECFCFPQKHNFSPAAEHLDAQQGAEVLNKKFNIKTQLPGWAKH